MGPRSDPRQLSDLLEVSQTLGATLNLRAALQRVLAILEESHGTLAGHIVLRDGDGGELSVEAASGAGARPRGRATGSARASSGGWSRAAARSSFPR